jgi:hypothetical protein
MPLLELPELAELKERPVVTSGFRSLDHLLPRGGVARGSLVEWLGDDDVSGATTLAAAVAVSLAGGVAAGGTILIVDRGGRFHPPAVMPWLAAAGAGGASRPQCVVARPARDDDEVWTIDQALRCPGVTAVLAWPRQVHPTAMRRWQLAARSSQAVGMLVRPGSARREPSWAMHRIAVAPVADGSLGSRRLRLSLVDGPWSAAGIAGGHERSVEVVLDLVRGREAAGGDHSLISMPGRFRQLPSPARLPPQARLPSQARLPPQEGDLVCRAS